MSELLATLGWGGFGLKARRSGTSTLMRLAHRDAVLSPQFNLFEHTAQGSAPGFTAEGFARPARVSLIERGLEVVSGGTDNHLMQVDLRPKNATGKRAEQALGRAFITCNKNGIPFDPEKPFVTSGVRLGTPAGTTRGFGEAEYREIAGLIVEVLDGLREANSDEGNAVVEATVRDKVKALTARFPIYAE